MSPADLQELADAFALCALAGGALGAAVYLYLRGLVLVVVAMVGRSQWYQDWQWRLYVRAFNEQTAREAAAARQRGRMTPTALAILAVVALVALAACAAPPPVLTGSDAWWDQVRSRTW